MEEKEAIVTIIHRLLQLSTDLGACMHQIGLPPLVVSESPLRINLGRSLCHSTTSASTLKEEISSELHNFLSPTS